MSIGVFTKSGAFVVLLLVLTVVGVPFGVEQVGEATGLYRFPVLQTVKGWFAFSAPGRPVGAAAKPVDWERYRRDLEEFTEWADGRSVAVVSLPKYDPEVIVLPEVTKTERKIWPVPVTSCTAGVPNGRKGYVFISGFDRPFEEGSVIESTKDRCGYEIVNVAERSVWFRAIFDTEGDARMGRVRFPEFERVEDNALVRRNRRYAVRDAFTLASGGWLMIDSFLPPDGTVFKIIDENLCEKASLLCVIISGKGGR